MKDKIIFKFGNARKSFDQHHPEVPIRKRKKKIPPAGAATANGGGERIFTWCLGKYLPELPVSEDEASIIIHIRNLQREFRKTGADVDITYIDQKMSLTFAERRKLIVTEKILWQKL